MTSCPDDCTLKNIIHDTITHIYYSNLANGHNQLFSNIRHLLDGFHHNHSVDCIQKWINHTIPHPYHEFRTNDKISLFDAAIENEYFDIAYYLFNFGCDPTITKNNKYTSFGIIIAKNSRLAPGNESENIRSFLIPSHNETYNETYNETQGKKLLLKTLLKLYTPYDLALLFNFNVHYDFWDSNTLNVPFIIDICCEFIKHDIVLDYCYNELNGSIESLLIILLSNDRFYDIIRVILMAFTTIKKYDFILEGSDINNKNTGLNVIKFINDRIPSDEPDRDLRAIKSLLNNYFFEHIKNKDITIKNEINLHIPQPIAEEIIPHITFFII